MKPHNLEQLDTDLIAMERRYREVKANNPKDRTWLAIGLVCVFAATVCAAIALSFLYNIAEGRI